MYVTKIKMKPGCYYSSKLIEIDQLYITGCQTPGYYKKAVVYDFLKECGTYYLATDDNGQPRVRPFGTVNEFEGKLYIQTGMII